MEPTPFEINQAARQIANVTGYCHDFHAGLSSSSADKLRECVKSILAMRRDAPPEVERLEALLQERDDFIVEYELWSAFVGWLERRKARAALAPR